MQNKTPHIRYTLRLINVYNMKLRHILVLLLPLVTTLLLIAKWLPVLHQKSRIEYHARHRHNTTLIPSNTQPTTQRPTTLPSDASQSDAESDEGSLEGNGNTQGLQDAASLTLQLTESMGKVDLVRETEFLQEKVKGSHRNCTLFTDIADLTSFNASSKNLRILGRVEYTHRRARRGEVTTRQLLERLQNEPFVEKLLYVDNRSTGYDPIFGLPPIILDPKYNSSAPFGKWHARFIANKFTGASYEDNKAHYIRHVIENPALQREMREPQLIPWQPPAYVAVFRSAWVGKGYAILCSQKAYGTGACMWEGPSGIPKTFQVYDLGAVVCDKWCAGYFHWVHEHLPRVALIAEAMRANRNIKLVLPTKSSFQRQFLRLLGINDTQLLPPGDYHFHRLLFPQPQRCGNVFSSTLFILRRLVFASLTLPAMSSFGTTAPLNVVLAERKGNSRGPQNYAELKQRLQTRFADRCRFAVHLGRSVAEQVALFNKAWIVFGPHGANLANVLFMRGGGAHLIEMLQWTKANLCYYTSASRVGVTYHMIPFTKGAYNVNYSHVEEHFNIAIRDYQQRG